MARAYATGGAYSAEAALPTQFQIVSNLDYFEDSGRTYANLKPNQQGVIELPASDLKGYSFIVIAVTDNTGTVVFTSPLDESVPKKVDLRVKEAKEQGIVYSEDFFALSATPAAAANVADMANTSQYMVEDMGSLLDVLLVIAGSQVNKTEIQKFKFLTTWNKTSVEERFKKWEEIGGHELNVFAFFRDRAFFDQHILPMLRFKAQKQLIDHLLIGDKDKYEGKIKIEQFTSLNVLE